MARRKEFNEEEIIEKIMSKKEFSKLPRTEVEKFYALFNKGDLLAEEKIKKTRDLLRRVYTAFINKRLLTSKNKNTEWFLKKHVSSLERLPYYEKVYKECFVGIDRNCVVFDFGSGINGLSYNYFKKVGFDVKYFGIEPVGQLVNLQNNYFKTNKINNAKVIKGSLFNLNLIQKKIIKTERPRVAFFFKVLDSLEMVEKNSSKKVLISLVPLFNLVIVSWATASLKSKKRFYAKRNWIKQFIKKEFLIIKEFEFGNEHYLVFSKK